MMSQQKHVDLFEAAEGNPKARIDAEAGVIRGVKVLGFRSRATGVTIGLDPAQYGEAVYEPYEYSPAAVAEAAHLYEGVRVYVDHPEFSYRADGERVASQRDRKLSEVFGRLVNVRLAETGLFADLEYVKSHPLAGQIVELAQKYPELLALSHNARGEPSLIDGKIVITEIGDVRSVDIVGERAGTTQSLFESEPERMAHTRLAPGKSNTSAHHHHGDHAAMQHGQMQHADPTGPTEADALHDKYSADTHNTHNTPSTATQGGDHFDAAFLKEIADIVSGEGTAAEKACKIKALLKKQEEIAGLRGEGEEEDVGGDLDDTDLDGADPEPEGDASGRPTTESAPTRRATSRTGSPSRSRLLTELLETVVVPCIDLCNAHGVPVRGATISALCRTPSKRRRALIETLAESEPHRSRTVARSQGGAIGIHETAPGARRRPGAQSENVRLLDASPDEIWTKYSC